MHVDDKILQTRAMAISTSQKGHARGEALIVGIRVVAIIVMILFIPEQMLSADKRVEVWHKNSGIKILGFCSENPRSILILRTNTCDRNRRPQRIVNEQKQRKCSRTTGMRAVLLAMVTKVPIHRPGCGLQQRDKHWLLWPISRPTWVEQKCSIFQTMQQ